MPVDQIQYSEKYSDDRYEYRHVILPSDIARHVPKTHLMTESEWRNLGVQQSPGWVHYMMHGPEPHVLLFRRMRPDIHFFGTFGKASSDLFLLTSPTFVQEEDYEFHVYHMTQAKGLQLRKKNSWLKMEEQLEENNFE